MELHIRDVSKTSGLAAAARPCDATPRGLAAYALSLIALAAAASRSMFFRSVGPRSPST